MVATPRRDAEFPGCTARPFRAGRSSTSKGGSSSGTRRRGAPGSPSPYREQPVEILSTLVDRIAAVRGSPVKCFGSMDLWLRGDRGQSRRFLQADQSVDLHPERAIPPGLSAMVIGEHDFPDVMLEVARSTDIRRSEIRLY